MELIPLYLNKEIRSSNAGEICTKITPDDKTELERQLIDSKVLVISSDNGKDDTPSAALISLFFFKWSLPIINMYSR